MPNITAHASNFKRTFYIQTTALTSLQSMVSVLQSDEDVVEGSNPEETLQHCGGLVNAIGNLLAANSIIKEQNQGAQKPEAFTGENGVNRPPVKKTESMDDSKSNADNINIEKERKNRNEDKVIIDIICIEFVSHRIRH